MWQTATILESTTQNKMLLGKKIRRRETIAVHHYYDNPKKQSVFKMKALS